MAHILTERLSHILALSEDVVLTRTEIIELMEKIAPSFGTVGVLRNALISHQDVYDLPPHCRLRNILIFYLEALPRTLLLSELYQQLQREARPPTLSELFKQDAKGTFWPHQKLRFWRAARRARQREIISNIH